ncbi:hypothetical protein T492DRAFT_979693 [Pavlovales sp. CCMP2436]|nr:hypothetical protein T492DRAFT_979693 [Pavlovales sp. CCMP2436]
MTSTRSPRRVRLGALRASSSAAASRATRRIPRASCPTRPVVSASAARAGAAVRRPTQAASCPPPTIAAWSQAPRGAQACAAAARAPRRRRSQKAWRRTRWARRPTRRAARAVCSAARSSSAAGRPRPTRVRRRGGHRSLRGCVAANWRKARRTAHPLARPWPRAMPSQAASCCFRGRPSAVPSYKQTQTRRQRPRRRSTPTGRSCSRGVPSPRAAPPSPAPASSRMTQPWRRARARAISVPC